MQLFYSSAFTLESTIFNFSKEESRHISRVLRKKEGDKLWVTNGKGLRCEAILISSDPKKCVAEVISFTDSLPSKINLHLAVAPTKMNDRFEWFLEKATEIGIQQITPIFCARSERKVFKPERFQKIIESASKQSLKDYFPVLHPAVSLKQFLNNSSLLEGSKFIAHCMDLDHDKRSLKQCLSEFSVNDFQSFTLLIGPEGDFTSDEVMLSKQHAFKAITLGEQRLRTETAAIVATHSINYHFEK